MPGRDRSRAARRRARRRSRRRRPGPPPPAAPGSASRARGRPRRPRRPGRTSAVRTIRRTVLASMTKFWPRCLVGRTPSAAASSRMSAGPRRASGWGCSRTGYGVRARSADRAHRTAYGRSAATDSPPAARRASSPGSVCSAAGASCGRPLPPRLLPGLGVELVEPAVRPRGVHRVRAARRTRTRASACQFRPSAPRTERRQRLGARPSPPASRGSRTTSSRDPPRLLPDAVDGAQGVGDPAQRPAAPPARRPRCPRTARGPRSAARRTGSAPRGPPWCR